MSTSAMNKSGNKRWRAVRAYLLAAAISIVVNFIYARFSHGVSSPSMTWMFLYPLLGGCLFFLLLGFLVPSASMAQYYRVFFNLHSSGIATLTVNSFFKGILEIAGTASSYTRMLSLIGWTLIIVGLMVLVLSIMEDQKSIGRIDGSRK